MANPDRVKSMLLMVMPAGVVQFWPPTRASLRLPRTSSMALLCTLQLTDACVVSRRKQSCFYEMESTQKEGQAHA
jgi:hypothetical protein